jgi:hypothetical protein
MEVAMNPKGRCLIPFFLFLILPVASSHGLEVGDSIVIWADDFNKDNSFQCNGPMDACPEGAHAPFGWQYDHQSSDNVWCSEREAGVTHLWVVHCETEEYVCPGAHPGINGEAWVRFPGPPGFYRIGVGMHWKGNGPEDFWIKLNGAEIFRGQSPFEESWCAGVNDKCYPIPGGCVPKIKLTEGDTVVWGGTTKWGSCPGDDGAGRGVYSAFYKMSFTLLPGGGPVVHLDKDSITFEAITGSAAPPAQTLTAGNTGDGSLPELHAQKVAAADWLTVTVEGTSIQNGLNMAGKAAGTYTESVIISGTDAGSDTYTVWWCSLSTEPGLARFPASVRVNTG